MYDTQAQVISLDEIRKRRGPVQHPTQAEEAPVSAQALAAASRAATELSALTRRVVAAMEGWSRLSGPMPPEEVHRVLPGLVGSIREAPGLSRQTGVEQLRKALEARFGDASLARAALMTPQELLDLPGVGRAALSRLIVELSGEAPMTVPELVTGTGKAEFDLVPVGRDRVEALVGLRGVMMSAPPSLA